MLDCDRRLMIVPLYVRVARKRAGEKLVSTQPNGQYREHPDYADSEIHRSIRKSSSFCIFFFHFARHGAAIQLRASDVDETRSLFPSGVFYP